MEETYRVTGTRRRVLSDDKAIPLGSLVEVQYGGDEFLGRVVGMPRPVPNSRMHVYAIEVV